MPDHCAPRNFEFEREQPWGGGPIMRDSDRPTSFLVRGAMPRRSAPETSDDGAGTVPEGKRVEPHGLAPPRLKPPPLRLYRVKPPSRSETPPDIDPADIVELFGGKFWVVDGDYKPLPGSEPQMPQVLQPLPKRPMKEPIPGLSKPSRGRHVPTRETAGPDRKHPCPVKGCDKMFTKRAHVNRHIASLHCHEKSWSCYAPFCDKNFTRYDNYLRHQAKHSHYQEIFQCAPDDEYKGVHLENPNVVDPDSFNIKPFAAIAIHPTALNLWRFQETQRRNGVNLPWGSDCDKYFAAHPEQMEAALRGDPEWEWRIPEPGEEFRRKDGRSLVGMFRLDIKPQQMD